ncbi:hypothetical protein [Kitasatospora sp. NPDC101183]|uniref:hypothetical protein n=1 Tax=Kitasatospora sp. NPDC101183 TaxID=3364100 RepID=UPI003823E1E4
MNSPPLCPCGSAVDFIGDANEAGRTWNCPTCSRWGVAWSASYLAKQPIEEPLVVLGRRFNRQPVSDA